MPTTILIAKLMGPTIFVAAIPMTISPANMQEIADQFLKNRALIFIAGLMALVGGLSVVNFHNIWVADWPVIITVFGWAMIVGGVIRVALPSVVTSVGGAMMNQPTMIRVFGVIWALIGAFLTYEGYF